MAKRRKPVTRCVGDVLAMTLGDDSYGFGRVLREPVVAFYDLNTQEIPDVEEILSTPIAFSVCVMNYAITKGLWQVLGNWPLGEDLLEEQLFFKEDPITKSLSIYRDSTGEETPATLEECEGLERAAVWDPCHIADRLFDHFAGRPNQWVESMRPTGERRKGP